MNNYICYLNGVSSCGKTSVAKFMLEKITDPIIYLSLDDFHNKLCDNYRGDDWKLYYEEVKALHRTARVWQEQGFNVIVDCVVAEARLWDDLGETLPDGFLVGLFAPLDVLLTREEARGRRHFGLVRHQFEITHQRLDQYALKIDSSRHPPEEIADYIISQLHQKYESD